MVCTYSIPFYKVVLVHAPFRTLRENGWKLRLSSDETADGSWYIYHQNAVQARMISSLGYNIIWRCIIYLAKRQCNYIVPAFATCLLYIHSNIKRKKAEFNIKALYIKWIEMVIYLYVILYSYNMVVTGKYRKYIAFAICF